MSTLNSTVASSSNNVGIDALDSVISGIPQNTYLLNTLGDKIWLKFDSINIQPLATINSATITIRKTVAFGAGSCILTASYEISNTSFTNGAAVADRTFISPLVTDAIPFGGTGADVILSTNITSLIQEAINDASWVYGNSLVIQLYVSTLTGGNTRTVGLFGNGTPAVLSLNFTNPASISRPIIEHNMIVGP